MLITVTQPTIKNKDPLESALWLLINSYLYQFAVSEYRRMFIFWSGHDSTDIYVNKKWLLKYLLDQLSSFIVRVYFGLYFILEALVYFAKAGKVD